MAQNKSTVKMISEFIFEFHENLKRVQVPVVTDEELIILIEDIRKFIREDFESNKKVIGMK